MHPAHQHLGAGKLVALQVDHRLVVHDELAALDAPVDRLRQRHLRQGLVVRGHGRGEQLYRACSLTQGGAEGQVRVGEQPVGVGVGRRGYGDADRRGHGDGVGAYLERLVQHLPDPPRDPFGDVGPAPRLAGDDQPVSLAAGQPVAIAQRRAQPAVYGGEQLVGCRVAVGALHQGELVEVDSKHDQLPAPLRREQGAKVRDELAALCRSGIAAAKPTLCALVCLDRELAVVRVCGSGYGGHIGATSGPSEPAAPSPMAAAPSAPDPSGTDGDPARRLNSSPSRQPRTHVPAPAIAPTVITPLEPAPEAFSKSKPSIVTPARQR